MKLDKGRLIKFIQKLISTPRDAHLSQLLINQILEKYQLQTLFAEEDLDSQTEEKKKEEMPKEELKNVFSQT